MDYNTRALTISCVWNRKALMTCALGLYFCVHFFSVFGRYDYLVLEAFFFATFFCIGGKLKLRYVALFPLLAIIAIRYFSGHSSVTGYFAPVNHFVRYFRLLCIPLLVDIFSQITPWQKKFLLWEVSVCVFITDIISLYHAHINPLSIRYRGLQDGIDYFGIIRFSQIFSFAIIEVFFFALLLDSKIPPQKKLFPLLVSAVNSLMLIKAQLMTPLIIMLIVATLYLFLETGKFTKRFLIFPSALLFFSVRKPVLIFFLTQIERLPSSIMGRRIESILNMLLLTRAGETRPLDNRIKKVQISLESFLKRPFFGIGFKTFDGTTVGCHQEWFDILAVSGVFVFLILLIFFLFHFRDIMCHCGEEKERHMFVAAFLAFLILGFLDPAVDYDLLITVFLLAPNYRLFGGTYDKRVYLYRPYL